MSTLEFYKDVLRPGRRDARISGFTLIELLVVISIIAVLASMLVGLAGTASRKSKESRIRAERDQYVTAIESYKMSFSTYPPDNFDPLKNTVNPFSNQLFYELTGTTFVKDRDSFVTLIGNYRINTSYVKQIFNRDGFQNSNEETNQVKQFIHLRAGQFQVQTNANGQIPIPYLVVPVDWPPSRTDNPIGAGLTINPWRYVSTSPTNNPNSFDLWADFVLGGKVKTIANW